MTAKAALCKALLEGRVLNIKNGFTLLGITNIPREIGRCIEDENRFGFGVKVSRTERKGVSQWGQPCEWIDYRLNRTEYNKPGIEKMLAYVKKEMETSNPKTMAEQKNLTTIKQLQLL